MNEATRIKIMDDFVTGKIKMLFSTTVLEVGIDVKLATVIIIESPEYFGLSQLHQLRGRVGRGHKQGYCYLVSSDEQAKDRLEQFTKINDGFRISELDLSIRGTGDFLGTRQSGLAKFRIGHLVDDYQILNRTREDAQLYFAKLKENGLMDSYKKNTSNSPLI